MIVLSGFMNVYLQWTSVKIISSGSVSLSLVMFMYLFDLTYDSESVIFDSIHLTQQLYLPLTLRCPPEETFGFVLLNVRVYYRTYPLIPE